MSKPLCITAEGVVYLETFSPFFNQACDFLHMVCEPQSRAQCMHEYRFTPSSLYSASSKKMTVEEVLKVLTMFSWNGVPVEVREMIERYMGNYGLVTMSVNEKTGRCYLDCASDEVFLNLMRDEEIRVSTVKVGKRGMELKRERLAVVKERLMRMNYPVMEEYALSEDGGNEFNRMRLYLPVDVKLRSYQMKALANMFCDGKVRSGIIVLPCGAGKTLTGIAAACTIGKRAMVICKNGVQCTQWKREFRRMTTLRAKNIRMFTSDGMDEEEEEEEESEESEEDRECLLVITTYTMIGMKDENRSARSLGRMEELKQMQWGLLILDEVHTAPAQAFRQAIYTMKAHCRLGLTATLVREDEQIEDLNFLVGPKLYDVSWRSLIEEGYLADVICSEVKCPLSILFAETYWNPNSNGAAAATRHSGKDPQDLLWMANPNKLEVVRQIMEYHESQGDKILVFADAIYVLERFAELYNRPCMSGKTANKDREKHLARFRLPYGHKRALQTLVLSRIGDEGIDLPEANVVLQICSHGGSRRQETQRFGRIMRPKKLSNKAYFYTFVTECTKEEEYARTRKLYLMDQGYGYKSLDWELHLKHKRGEDLHTVEEQRAWLAHLARHLKLQ